MKQNSIESHYIFEEVSLVKNGRKAKKVSNHAGLRRLALKSTPADDDRKIPHTRQKHIVFEGERKFILRSPFLRPHLQSTSFSMGVKEHERTGNRPCEPEGRCNQNDQLRQSSGWSGAGGEKGVSC